MRCKFWKTCKLYDKLSLTCNENAGMYYQDGTKPAGCYRKKSKEKK